MSWLIYGKRLCTLGTAWDIVHTLGRGFHTLGERGRGAWLAALDTRACWGLFVRCVCVFEVIMVSLVGLSGGVN